MKTKAGTLVSLNQLAQDANWSVGCLAAICGISVRTLERHFRRNFNSTPKAWLEWQRQELAESLLSQSCSVKETAARLGYKHATNFSRKYKKVSGQTPNTRKSRTKEAIIDDCRTMIQNVAR